MSMFTKFIVFSNTIGTNFETEWQESPGFDTVFVVLCIIALSFLFYIFQPHEELYRRVRYVMAKPYFFSGEDLSACPNRRSFVRLLMQKVENKTGTVPIGVHALDWDNSHQMYVIARLEVDGSRGSRSKLGLSSVHAIEKWFWDPKNQLLKFQKHTDYAS